MTRTPWWYSGEEAQEPEPSPDVSSSEDQDSARSVTDWGALLSGAQRLVDWATDTVMAPHSEHVDPRDHPDCVICKAIALLPEGTRRGQAAPASDDGGTTATTTAQDDPTESFESSTIEWIPIRGDLPAL